MHNIRKQTFLENYRSKSHLGDYRKLFKIFKKLIIKKIDNNADSLEIWNLYLQLFKYFDFVLDEETISIKNVALEKMIDYYSSSEKYNLSNLSIALCRLKPGTFFRKCYLKDLSKLDESYMVLKDNYTKLLESIILYIARSLEHVENSKEMIKVNGVEDVNLVELLRNLKKGL